MIQDHSGTTPSTSRNAFCTSQGVNEEDSQSDPHAEAGTSQSQTTQNFRWEVAHDMVILVHEELTNCSPSTSSGKRKKNRSTSQPQIRSENTLVTIEADQIMLALQQLANNDNSATFRNKIFRTSELPKSLTTTVPLFDGKPKPQKFELFEDFFQTSLKIHNQLTEDDKINYFQSPMMRDALQTFTNINGPIRENLADSLAIFRRKYVKPQSMATTKHKIQKSSIQ